MASALNGRPVSWFSMDSSKKVARGRMVDDPISTSGSIDATASWVSGSETAGVTAVCGATTAWGSDREAATPEVRPNGSLPDMEETTGVGLV